jgi:hypothetical protein
MSHIGPQVGSPGTHFRLSPGVLSAGNTRGPPPRGPPRVFPPPPPSAFVWVRPRAVWAGLYGPVSRGLWAGGVWGGRFWGWLSDFWCASPCRVGRAYMGLCRGCCVDGSVWGGRFVGWLANLVWVRPRAVWAGLYGPVSRGLWAGGVFANKAGGAVA